MAKPRFPLNFQAVFPLLYYKGVHSLDMSPGTCSPNHLGRIPSVGAASLQCDLQLPSFKRKDRETAVLAQPAPGKSLGSQLESKGLLQPLHQGLFMWTQVCLRRNKSPVLLRKDKARLGTEHPVSAHRVPGLQSSGSDSENIFVWRK